MIFANYKNYFLLFLLIANIYCWAIIIDYFAAPLSEVNFLPVGQGDAALIKTKAGNILIDAGPGGQILPSLGKILPFYDRTIDLFILSHPNRDHYRGFFDVLSRYRIRGIIFAHWLSSDSEYQKLLKKIRQKNILFIKGEKGSKINFDEERKLIILYPDSRTLNTVKNFNEASIVLNFTNGKENFLFTGDIGKITEKKLLSFLFPITVLKVAHHGSKHSSSKEFLEIIKPRFAVFSVGKNQYGHPSREVKERLNAIGAEIFRTDLDGIIRFWQTPGREFFFRRIKLDF